MYETELKTKEIGIRKVVGASVFVSLIAIRYHTIRAANGNMVDAVKWE